MPSYRYLVVSLNPPIARVALNHPPHNTLTRGLFLEIADALTSLDQDPAIRVIVLCAEGENFSYGLDLKEAMVEMAPAFGGERLASSRKELLQYIQRFQRATQTPAEIQKPVLSVIHGFCIGGALELICACDLRVAERSARFTLKEVALGIVADLGGLQRLPLLVGEGRARELALTGREFSAEEAYAMGLITQLYPDRTTLEEGAMELARRIAELPPLAVQGVKRVLNERIREEIERGLGYVAVWNSAFLLSRDLLEALQAFQEKRPPRFTGD
jgi:enoyl-CoA hydratase